MDHKNSSELNLEDYDSDSNEDEAVSSINACPLVTEKEINRKDDSYILHLSATSDASCNILIGTSNNSCEIFRLGENRLAKLETLENFEHPIIGVQFSPESNDLMYIATSLGNIQLWDLRTPQKFVVQFTEKKEEGSSNDLKTLACFNASANNRLLTAGTELYKGEAFILFWDIRNTTLMGGYWESHTDDVTQVVFDPNDADKLMSGSVDGLINVYDVKHTNEDDALMDSFNTESSVEQLCWYSNKGKDFISCITHTADVQLWSPDDAEPYAHFRRSDITKAMKRKSEAHCYVAGAHRLLGNELLILAGSNWNDGEHLKCMSTSNKKLESFGTLKENRQRVRCSVFNQYHNLLMTGGEQGILNVWNVNLNV
ncbi:hypothetical protein PPYR_00386 [Photinus pyralis]|uniref:WD repeat-containing protein 89 n=1 Tax=Photinus pyralis TaxID=7054 RepID=A0A5N4AHF5_PHOPY|nr:WD repeat-containing protein 89-like [Photinus pyralis]XP_031344336.1 WD repeat-containing protein 89-like [Photinus pyralis]XP_031348952.1 WD repeat-containing protein 89-like [Photinus pyralis]KAB0796741.1 hypothetical protein PPYR_10802 [Photinus pyralis]KAB0803416.1 hypothetical protein PPYR_00386 [Photinus pyralis]